MAKKRAVKTEDPQKPITTYSDDPETAGKFKRPFASLGFHSDRIICDEIIRLHKRNPEAPPVWIAAQ